MCKFLFLSTLSLRRATHYDNYNLHCVEISIHALLAESDSLTTYLETSSIISIHALLAESDSRAETVAAKISNFYPRSPCGERQQCASLGWQPWYISIHALLAESDVMHFLGNVRRLLFLSTLSLRRATDRGVNLFRFKRVISIHALLAESDPGLVRVNATSKNFYPRSPCGERHSMGGNEKSFRNYFYPRSPCGERLRGWTLNINGSIFLSTLSLRRATYKRCEFGGNNGFLSTLSLRRATCYQWL